MGAAPEPSGSPVGLKAKLGVIIVFPLTTHSITLLLESQVFPFPGVGVAIPIYHLEAGAALQRNWVLEEPHRCSVGQGWGWGMPY